ncbi:MAG: alpha/beta hydrolase [Chloroflexi bacterium]|nr:alpha/beta hydrolase [Chloroflexota bacterium]
MGAVILVVAFMIEGAFAAFCINTKSYQAKVRNLIRIGAFAGFVLLTLLAVIEWNMRWYGLAALLFVWAALGAQTLILGKADKKEFKGIKIGFQAFGSLLLVTAAVIPALIFPQYKPLETTGPYQAATITDAYTDTSRVETYTTTVENRMLNVQLWYPQNGNETYPLIVFSHGTTGTRTSNLSLYHELASHGYVVAAIDHTYHALFTTFPDGRTIWIDRGYINEFAAEDAHKDRQQSYAFYQKWMKIRMDDINFVIDTILSKAQEGNPETVYRLVDPEKIGVMGHSMGGSAALGIGRVRQDVGAVIALESPFMFDIVGTKDGEFVWNEEPYPIPVLNVYTESWDHLDEWKQYARNYALLSDTGATAFNVYIRGAVHLSLTDLSLSSPFLTNMLTGKKAAIDAKTCLTTINKITLEFFDSYLKGKGTFTAAGVY